MLNTAIANANTTAANAWERRLNIFLAEELSAGETSLIIQGNSDRGWRRKARKIGGNLSTLINGRRAEVKRQGLLGCRGKPAVHPCMMEVANRYRQRVGRVVWLRH